MCLTMNGRPPAKRAGRKAGGKVLSGKSGFTYIGALIVVVVMGISLSTASRYWSTVVKREKETELIFRGDQIRRAIESYCKTTPGGKKPEYPKSLKDLVKDPRFLTPRRHLRKSYRDPMTEEGRWGLVLDSKGGIKGVYSKSEKEPLKVRNFPSDYASLFEKAKKYSDWKFLYPP